MKTYINIFLAFLRCGVFGFGGGHATVPLIEKEVVESFGWLTNNEFTDAYAFASSLPGPVTTKLSALVGYKTAGVLGSLIAILGMVLPSAIAIVILFSLYLKNKEVKWIQGMMNGVRPVVVIMIGSVLYKMGKRAFIFENISGINIKMFIITSLIGIISGILIIKFEVNPIFLIISSLILGGLLL